MNQPTLDRLGRLNGFQIAALAFLTSATAAVAVLLTLRRFLFARAPEQSDDPDSGPDAAQAPSYDMQQPETPEAMATVVPHHFSENLVVPGLTKTGLEILQDDDRNGKSPEGV